MPSLQNSYCGLEKEDEDQDCEWMLLGSEPYCKRTLATAPEWKSSLQLEDCKFCAALSAGPTCFIPGHGWGTVDEQSFLLTRNIYWFSCSGKLLNVNSLQAERFVGTKQSFVTTKSLREAGFLQDESVLLIFEDGTLARVLQDSPVIYVIGSVFEVLEVEGGSLVQSAIITNDDCFIMETTKKNFYLVQDILRGKFLIHRFSVDESRAKENVAITCYQVLASGSPPLKNSGTSSNHDIQLLIGYEDGTVISSNLYDHLLLYQLEGGYFISFSVSRDGRWIAAIESGKHSLWIFSSDMNRAVLSNWLPSPSFLRSIGMEELESVDYSNLQIDWCASEAVAWYLVSHSFLLLVDIRGNCVHLSNEACFLYSELDGLRWIEQERVYYIYKASKPLYDLQNLGNTEDISLLFSCFETFDGRTRDSDEKRIQFYQLVHLLFSKSSGLLDIVETILDNMVLEEWNIGRQKKLLKLASFCIAYQGSYQNQSKVTQLADQLSVVCRTLRLLNCLRRQCDIPITFVQSREMSGDKLMDRISRYGYHEKALSISIYLGIDPSIPLIRWAKQELLQCLPKDTVIHPDVQDREMIESNVMEKISKRLEYFTEEYQIAAPPYTDIALMAWKLDLSNLAIWLTQKEQRMYKKVPLLLMQNKEQDALKAASEDGDPELLQGVFIRLRQRHTLAEMLEFFRSNNDQLQDAVRLYAAFLRRHAILEEWNSFMLSFGLRPCFAVLSQAHLSLQRTAQRKKTLEWLSLQMNRTAKRSTWLGWSLKNECKISDLATELEQTWKLQENSLDVSSISRFIVSVAEQSVHLSPSERRDCLYRIKNQFKVPERRFIYNCLQGMANIGDFEEICLRHGRLSEASQFIKLIKEPQERAIALAKAGYGKEAAELAMKWKNQRLLQQIYEIVPQSS
ncbi:protein vacuoleless1 [Galdieria sulphuraria]|nr:protein vacuoleless1 [Galdieria sulphuraria]